MKASTTTPPLFDKKSQDPLGLTWKNQIVTAAGVKEYNYKEIEGGLAGLGDEGWELATISPRSSHFAEAAGVTSEELWVFKRPKE